MKTRNWSNERGANLIEYTLLLVLLCLIGIPAVSGLGTQVKAPLEMAAQQLGSGGDNAVLPTDGGECPPGGCLPEGWGADETVPQEDSGSASECAATSGNEHQGGC